MASKDKIFLDTDVALDHLADRQPFGEYAHRILGLAETGEIIVCLSSLSFSNLGCGFQPLPERSISSRGFAVTTDAKIRHRRGKRRLESMCGSINPAPRLVVL